MSESSVIDRLSLGDHVCWAFGDDEDHLAASARFVAAGLADGQKVAYFTESLMPTALLAGLEVHGVRAEAAAAAGQLEIQTAEQAYLPDGRFDPAATIETMAGHIVRATEDGYAGLRFVSDMAWALRPVTGVEHLAWYEAQLNRLFMRGQAMALCQYDRRLFAAGQLGRVASAHPGATTVHTSQQGWAPLLRMRCSGQPPGLRLIGEADLSNRHALAAVLAALFDNPVESERPVVIDASELSFADGAAAHLLVQAARAAPAGLRLVGCRPPLARLLSLVGADSVAGLTVTSETPDCTPHQPES